MKKTKILSAAVVCTSLSLVLANNYENTHRPSPPAHVALKAKLVASDDGAIAHYVKPDEKLALSLIESFNKRDFTLFKSLMSKHGFNFISPYDIEIKSEKDMGFIWKQMFGDKGTFDLANFRPISEAIFVPAPGIATITTRLTFDYDNRTIPGSLSTTIKYENEQWKIISARFSSFDLIKFHSDKDCKALKNASKPFIDYKKIGYWMFSFMMGSFSTVLMIAFLKRCVKKCKKK